MRFYILTKTTGAEIIKLISPNSVVNRNMYATGKKITDDNIKNSFLSKMVASLGEESENALKSAAAQFAMA